MKPKPKRKPPGNDPHGLLDPIRGGDLLLVLLDADAHHQGIWRLWTCRNGTYDVYTWDGIDWAFYDNVGLKTAGRWLKEAHQGYKRIW